MKRFVFGLLALCFFALTSCKKDGFITSPDALLTTSSDTLRFDTVFTSTGSVTHSFKIFNHNDRKLRLSNVELAGGAASAFKVNVDGAPGSSFTNVDILPNDSAYVFVSVSINPNSANLPFIVQDSLRIKYNGREHLVQLEAYGQNANFLRARTISTNTVWNNTLPYVILGSLTVSNAATLTINKGTKIYCHADAPIIINGTLKVNGERFDSTKVIFQSDRLDQAYKDFPGGWPGIYFTPSSKDNVLTYAVIQNAYQGIIAQLPSSNNNPKVTLNQTIINNISDAGILAINSSINATNCLISNCGSNISLSAGGNYTFLHCTVATYGSIYVPHKNPVLTVSDNSNNQNLPLTAAFRNSIFWGEGGNVDDEINVSIKGQSATVIFQNILYKSKKILLPAPTASILNQSPAFDSINVARRIFDFRLKENSPARNVGANLGITTDIDGRLRTNPDLGCYEWQ